MPGKFTNKNGASIAGHSDKWSNDNRRSNSHDSGQGNRGSRNQGTGIAGKANTMPTNGVDTSKMKPEDKLKYFKSLGLMPGRTPEPEQPKAVNPVKELTTKLTAIFKDTPSLLMDIVKDLREIPQDQLKQKSLAILNVMKDNNSTNPHDVSGVIMSVLKDEPQVSDLDFIKNFFHKAGKNDRKRPEDVDGLIGRFIERSGNDDVKIAKAKSALEELNKTYVPGEQSKYIAGMNAAFGAL